MSFVPAFEVGLWNAWIFMVFLLATSFLPSLIDKEKMEKRMEGDPAWGELNKTTKIVFVITHIMIMPFTFIYSIFLPLKLDTLWYFVGLSIYLLGLVISLLFGISFAKAPLGEPIRNGVFSISRHPGYLSFFLVCIGIGIACSSWVYLLCAFVWIVSLNFGVIEEEHNLIEKYGDAYKEYMNRTPRWIGFPKTK